MRIERQEVRSSAIVSVGYQGGNLDIEMTSGVVYRYRNVPDSDWLNFMSAASIGRHYSKEIRGCFQSVRLCWTCQSAPAQDNGDCQSCRCAKEGLCTFCETPFDLCGCAAADFEASNG